MNPFSTYFQQLKLQARLISLVMPIFLVGTLITAFSVIVVNRAENLAWFLRRSSDQSFETFEASTRVYQMQLAGIDYIATGDESYAVTHNLLRQSVDDYLTTYQIVFARELSEDYPDLYATVNTELQQMVAESAHYDEIWAALRASDDPQSDPDLIDEIETTSDEIAERTYLIQDELDLTVDDTAFFIDGVWFRAFLGGIFSVLVFVVLVVYTGRMVSREIALPLLDLFEAAEAIQRDEFNPDSITELTARRDEIGLMARALAEMGEQIEAEEQELEQQIAGLQTKLRKLRRENT